MTDLKKTLKEYQAIKAASRRAFITRLGSAGLGVAAGAAIAGCGGGGSGFGSSPASGSSGSGGYVNTAELVKAFQGIQVDENTHVSDLKSALGANARPRPTFDPNLLDISKNSSYPNSSGLGYSIQNLINATADLENTGTGAYPYVLTNPNFAGALATAQTAATIALVEGRHAGFVNALLGRYLLTAPNGDTAVPAGSVEVIQAPSNVVTRATPFLFLAPGTINIGSAPGGVPVAGNTYLNGYGYDPDGQVFAGAIPAGATGVPGDNVGGAGATSAVSINGILNYALLLEYLERDFYNLNIPLVLGSSGYTLPAGAIAYSQTGP